MFFGRDDKKEAPKRAATVPLLPLRDIIVFPHMVVPLFVGREKSIAALKDAMAHKAPDDKAIILLAAQKKAKTNDPTPEDVFHFGTLGHVIQLLPLPDGTVKVLVEGVRRARIKRFLPNDAFFMVEVEEVEEQVDKSVELEALVRSVHSVFEAFVKLNKRIPPEMLMQVASIDDPARLADTIVAHLSLKLNDKQQLLETEAPAKRLEKLYELMQGEIEILQVEKKIRTRVKKQMEKTQKEYYLNEQMQAIQKELGERDEFKNEIQEIEE
ncbi:MAG TPA: LON peptidase substrate-binding domain-containing protein, partial [Myxococcaceae bacterium]|nr:LON peptidase substrate-binding domain-containing protein [Myxococcaceae bacterium]